MQTVLITGGSGLVGKQLTKHLTGKGYRVIILTRWAKVRRNSETISYASWDIKEQTIDIQAIQSADFKIGRASCRERVLWYV